MVEANRQIVELRGSEYDEKNLEEHVLNSERTGRQISRPSSDKIAQMLRKVVHKIIATRLINARNRTKLNNDKINRLMLDECMKRRRDGKGWTFTNATDIRKYYLLDEEEVEILARILDIPQDHIGMHLRVIPWALAEQKTIQEKRRKKTAKSRNGKSMPADEPAPIPPYEDEVKRETVIPRDRTTEVTQNSEMPIEAGDLKISHSGKHLRVSGKIWCDLETAQKLRMILPLKLINQARRGDPWCYEIGAKVFPYQLYNLIHVLYGAPRVLKVEGTS